MNIHKLLERQVKKHLSQHPWQHDEALTNFIRSINQSYEEFDESQLLSEHAFNLVDKEYTSLTQSLHESQTRMKTIIEGALDAVISMDKSGKIIDWNPEAEKVFGYTFNEAHGKHLADLIIPEELKAAHNRGLSHYLTTGAGPVLGKRIEITARRANGETFPVELTISVLYDKEEPFFNAFLRDITIRKKAEKELSQYSQSLQEMVVEQTLELQASEARLRSITENAPDFIIELDINGNILFINRSFFPDSKKEDTVGKAITDWVAPQFHEPLTTSLEKVFKCGIKTQTEIKTIGEDGIERTWIASMSPVLIDGVTASVILIPYDISERIQNEKDLLNAKEVAERANASKTEFLANVSHELRTPLNGIIGFSDLLIKTPLNEAQKKYMGIVSQSADTLLDLIQDILDFSVLDANKLQVHHDQVDLRKLVQQVEDMIKHQVDKKGLSLLITISQNIPTKIVSDEMRLKQVLTNLLSNAVKFTHTGSIELKLEQLMDNETNSLKVRFSVTDTGIGIRPENQKRIFDAFEQEDISTTKKFGGTGLGLTISNKLLALMGSRLCVQSKLGKGSTFSFDLSLPTTTNI